jgi:hypothetical protein
MTRRIGTSSDNLLHHRAVSAAAYVLGSLSGNPRSSWQASSFLAIPASIACSGME